MKKTDFGHFLLVSSSLENVTNHHWYHNILLRQVILLLCAVNVASRVRRPLAGIKIAFLLASLLLALLAVGNLLNSLIGSELCWFLSRHFPLPKTLRCFFRSSSSAPALSYPQSTSPVYEILHHLEKSLSLPCLISQISAIFFCHYCGFLVFFFFQTPISQLNV